MLALFFTGLVISLIATVFIMDGSLKNFYAEQEQIEAERKGREYISSVYGATTYNDALSRIANICEM